MKFLVLFILLTFFVGFHHDDVDDPVITVTKIETRHRPNSYFVRYNGVIAFRIDVTTTIQDFDFHTMKEFPTKTFLKYSYKSGYKDLQEVVIELMQSADGQTYGDYKTISGLHGKTKIEEKQIRKALEAVMFETNKDIKILGSLVGTDEAALMKLLQENPYPTSDEIMEALPHLDNSKHDLKLKAEVRDGIIIRYEHSPIPQGQTKQVVLDELYNSKEYQNYLLNNVFDENVHTYTSMGESSRFPQNTHDVNKKGQLRPRKKVVSRPYLRPDPLNKNEFLVTIDGGTHSIIRDQEIKNGSVVSERLRIKGAKRGEGELLYDIEVNKGKIIGVDLAEVSGVAEKSKKGAGRALMTMFTEMHKDFPITTFLHQDVENQLLSLLRKNPYPSLEEIRAAVPTLKSSTHDIKLVIKAYEEIPDGRATLSHPEVHLELTPKSGPQPVLIEPLQTFRSKEYQSYLLQYAFADSKEAYKAAVSKTSYQNYDVILDDDNLPVKIHRQSGPDIIHPTLLDFKGCFHQIVSKHLIRE